MTEARLPLEHVRVVDFTWYAAGPLCTRLLANHGAQVIKIESSARLDMLRMVGPKPPGNQSINASGYFNNSNTDKLGISLNLKKPEAIDIVKRLVSISDVVIDNFSVAVLDRLGVTYDILSSINPTIVMLRMPPMGTTGPRKDGGLQGNNLAAMAGLYHLSGYEDRQPVGPGMAFADYTYNPFHAATAVLAALHHRSKTGEGQFIDMSQFESTTSALGHFVLDAAANGRSLKRTGNRSQYCAPHGVYKCLGQDRWCAIVVSNDAEWKSFCHALDSPSWCYDPKFVSPLSRMDHQEELDGHIEAWTSHRTAEQVMCHLQQSGISAGVVQNAQDTLTKDPQLQARGQYQTLDHPEVGPASYDGPTFILSKTPASLRKPAPTLGQDNDYVLTELLGFDDERLSNCVLDGVIV